MSPLCKDCGLCLSQKGKYEIGDLVALKTAPLKLEVEGMDNEQRYVNGVVVRLESNELEELAVVKLIGRHSINGLERVFSHKDVYFLNKVECPSV